MADEKEVAERRGISETLVRRIKRGRGITNDSLLAISDHGLRSLLRKLELPDRPRAREAFLRRQRLSDDGTLADGGLARALQQLDSARRRATPSARIAGIPTGQRVDAANLKGSPLSFDSVLGVDQSAWTSLGPGNIGGRTRSLVIHPEHPQLIWAGSVGGGVWHTENGGESWQPVDDQMANLAVACMVMDPADPNVIYAGTGEGFSNLDAIRGAGIFVTTNGVDWRQITSTAGTAPVFRYINRLALSNDGQILYAATNSGIVMSADTDRQMWTRSFDQAAIADLRINPTDSRHLVAGGLDNGEAYVSRDGGRSWFVAQHEEPWQGRVELTMAAANPRIVYASVEMTSGEIWRSMDGGQNYQRRDALTVEGEAAPYLGDQGWYDNTIWAGDPQDANLVIVGGIDLWRSTDGGNTLMDISTWWSPRSVHADHHVIAAHPHFDGKTNLRIYCGNDGGIYTTSNIRKAGSDAQLPRNSGWQELINSYGVTQFYGGAGNAKTGTIVGGAQDNGSLAFFPDQGGEAWSEFFGGDGGFVAADPTDPKVFYGEYVFLNIHRNTDGVTTGDSEGDRYISGQFFDFAAVPEPTWNWKPLPFRIPDAQNQNALFIAPFVLDPNEPDRILAGGQSLWRTNDAKTPNTPAVGPAWSSIKGSVGELISAIAIADGDADRVWVGHEQGQVFRTLSGQAAFPVWQRVDNLGSQPLSPGRFCTRIVIDSQDFDTVYVTYGGYDNDNVWKTTDGGVTWMNIATSIPDVPVRSLAIHPRISSCLYLGTEVGVFGSENAGATWSPTNEGPTNSSVYELFWMDEVLICTTHGRGMFQIDLSGL